MPKLRLTDADQKRLGVEGDLPIDLNSITNREAIALARIGYATPWLFRSALFSDDSPVDATAVTGLVWLCLRRAGVEVDLETFEFDFDGWEFLPDEPAPEVVAPEGKAPDPEASTSSSRPRSRRTATSKAK